MKIYHLICPVCGKIDDVYYRTKPPTYCSDTCKQRAYRQRKQKRNNGGVTNLRQTLTRRFGDDAGYRLFIIYQKCGQQVGTECERAVFEAARYLNESQGEANYD